MISGKAYCKSGFMTNCSCKVPSLFLTFLLLAMAATALSAQPEATSRAASPIIKYRTREEKREAGLSHELTDWLQYSTVVESEFLQEKSAFDTGIYSTGKFVDPAVQFNFEFGFADVIEAELILEYTEDSSDPLMDELLIAGDAGNFGITTGRYYVPFGEYYSNFINGPLLEFSQTRADVLQLDYDFDDRMEVAAYVFDGKARPAGGLRDYGWGVAFESKWLNDHLLFGGGYISSLADSELQPYEDFNNRYSSAVPAWNLYLIGEWEYLGFSLERVAATDYFHEHDPAEDRPAAWNMEAVFYPLPTLEAGLRLEQASEIVDEAERQYGMELTWRPANRLSFTMEFLKGSFRRSALDFEAGEDEEGEVPEPALRSSWTWAASFSFIF